jgi:hypothetical protein
MDKQIKETLDTIESLIARGFYRNAAMMARVLSEQLLARLNIDLLLASDEAIEHIAVYTLGK